MQLILAIDSDRRQADQLASLVRSRLTVDLVQATSAGEGLQALQDRVPDLILTSPLLSPFDDGVLDEYLRDLGAAATHVQTLRIPVLSVATKKASAKRLFSLGRKKPTASSAPEGCDPTLFADEIALYLTRAAEERQALSVRVASAEDARAQEALDSVEPLLATFETSVAEPVAVPEPMYASAPEIYSSERVTYSSAPPSSAPPLAYAEPAPEPIVEELLAAEEPPAFEEPLVVAAPLALEERLIVEEQLVVEETFVLESRPEPVSELVTPPAYTFEAIDPVDALPIEMAQESEPVVAVIEVAPVAIEPLAVEANHVPEPAAKAKRPTASFEAALAAIRAAWAKPNDAAIVPEPAAKSATPAAESPAAVSAHGADVTGEAIPAPAPAMAAAPVTKAPTAPPVEVDLTGEIDALESTIVGETSPAVADEPSAEDPQAPATAIRRRTEKNKKRPEKARGRKLRGADGRPVQDEWGMFDPNQCGFSALVNKLDEVTEPDEAPPQVGTTVRVISFG